MEVLTDIPLPSSLCQTLEGGSLRSVLPGFGFRHENNLPGQPLGCPTYERRSSETSPFNLLIILTAGL